MGLPSQRQADPFLSADLEDGLQEGRVSGHDPARLPTDGGASNGVPRIVEGVAMKITGHKTRSAFARYNIVSETDLLDAGAKLDTAVTATATRTATQTLDKAGGTR